VRVEIAAAFAGGKIVVPILLDGASMPKAAALPADLAGLSAAQALAATSGGLEAALDRLISEHRLGVIGADALMAVLTAYPEIVEWAPNLRAKGARVTGACSLRPYERLAGILDLTIAGNGDHFLAFTNAGLHHRSVGSAAAFRAYGRIGAVRLDPRRSTLFLDDEGWNITGTIEDDAERLVRDVLRAFATG
jgi:hypothetical protein